MDPSEIKHWMQEVDLETSTKESKKWNFFHVIVFFSLSYADVFFCSTWLDSPSHHSTNISDICNLVLVIYDEVN